MADIRPFQGLRFDQRTVGDLASVVTPPYDVIDAAAQEEYYRRSPHNIIRIELGKQLPGDSPGNNRYTRARAALDEWMRAGALRTEPAPAVYAYQQTFTHRGCTCTRTGFMAAMRLEEWEKGIVLPHEATMAGPKADRLELMRAAEVNCSPIFALYQDAEGVARATLTDILAAPPATSFHDEAGEQRLWIVTDQAVIARLQRVLRSRPVYIADGHHRYETALYYRDERRAANPGYHRDEPWNFVLTLLVEIDDPGLVVLPTHRMINPRHMAAEALTELFVVEQLSAGDDHSAGLARLLAELERRGPGDPIFGAYGLPPGGFSLIAPRSRDLIAQVAPAGNARNSLDVSILHDVLLPRVCGLTESDFEDETRAAYTRDEEAALRAVLDDRYRLAVFLNPTDVRQVLEVARAGEVMPRKSTYFHPKPLTGLVLNRLTDSPPDVR